MKLPMFRLILGGAAALAFVTARPALADDESTDDQNQSNTDHANPKADPPTLPSHASDTAKARAFGQQGAKMKAVHAAAKSAAVRAAQAAANATTPTLPAQAVAGKAHAASGSSHAAGGQPDSPGSQGERGLDTAAAHGAKGSPTSHPGGH